MLITTFFHTLAYNLQQFFKANLHLQYRKCINIHIFNLCGLFDVYLFEYLLYKDIQISCYGITVLNELKVISFSKTRWRDRLLSAQLHSSVGKVFFIPDKRTGFYSVLMCMERRGFDWSRFRTWQRSRGTWSSRRSGR